MSTFQSVWKTKFLIDSETTLICGKLPLQKLMNDNDNDNDTLREVPHPSNEGLALQARVSGPWPHKKESVLLV